MFLPRNLLAVELQRRNVWKTFLKYEDHLIKIINNELRNAFLQKCKRADIIPKFLKFRIPTNGCFDDKTVHEFQRKLLHKEIIRAKMDLDNLKEHLNSKRELVKQEIPHKCLPSVILHSRISQNQHRVDGQNKHNKKLHNLSQEQGRPLFNVKNTVRLFDLPVTPPAYVIETLSLGPRTPILNPFDPKEVLATLDGFLYDCKQHKVSDEMMTDINIKTINYIKKCDKLKPSRNMMMTNKYLRENKLLAIPFDKGVGICLMTKDTYEEKMRQITDLPQFQKYEKPRKNAKNPVLKEEERIISILKNLRATGKINEDLYQKLSPVGSQPPRLYGLAKVHKKNTPMRPVLSMPGSAYYKIAKEVTQWLSNVKECQIQCSTKLICDSLKDVQLEDNEKLVSFDVSSLYTNVPVEEAINTCADLLFNSSARLPVDKDTFITLAKLASCNVVMSTSDGYFTQVDGLAMGSPCAPLLANGWLSQFDSDIKGNAKLYFRYMDDIIRDISSNKLQEKLQEINSYHESLKFTQEEESDGILPFLDMSIRHNEDGTLSSTWYYKPSDTGLIMNFHALAPMRYKRAVVCGFVHRIYRSCTSWELVHESLERAKVILTNNQYPPRFFEKIIHDTLTRIVGDIRAEKEKPKEFLLFLQYRGKNSETYARDLRKIGAPCRVIFSLRKLKTVTPSLKPPVEKTLKSGVVYKIECPRCSACYVGATARHLTTRFKEHIQKNEAVSKHLSLCGSVVSEKDLNILSSTLRGPFHLFTLEALWIREIKPQLNVKDEYRKRELVIKF